MVKFKINALSEVAESLHGLYEQQADGTFQLKIEGMPAPASAPAPAPGAPDPRLKEFRDNNIALKKQLDELQAKFEGVDLEALEMGKAAIEKARNDRERELIRAGRFDDVFEMRLAELKKSHSTELQKVMTEAEKIKKQSSQYRDSLRETKVQSHILAKAAEHKLQILPTAQDDFVRRARSIFDINDEGQVVALDGEGNTRLNKESKPFTEMDFFQDIVDDAPHLLASAQGAGISGPGSRGRGGVMSIDPTDQKAFGANLEKIAKGDIEVRTR